MNKLNSLGKKITTITFNIVASILTFIVYTIPIYKYEWANDPDLSYIDSDKILVIMVFSFLSLIIASIAFFLKRKPLSLTIYIVFLVLNVYKIVISLPLYEG